MASSHDPYNILYDESLSASLHWNPFTSLKLARTQALCLQRPPVAATPPPTSSTTPSAGAGSTTTAAAGSSLAVPSSPGTHKRSKSSGHISPGVLEQLQAQQFQAFEAIVTATPPSPHAHAASARAASTAPPSLAGSHTAKASSSTQPVALDWKNQQTVKNLRSILASLDSPIEEVPFGSPIGSPARFASPVNVPMHQQPQPMQLLQPTLVAAAAPSLPPKKSSKSQLAKPPAAAPAPVAKREHRSSTTSSSGSSGSSGGSAPAATVADATPPPPLPKKSKKRDGSGAGSLAVPKTTAGRSSGHLPVSREHKGDKVQRSPSRRAYDDLFGTEEAAVAAAAEAAAVDAKSGKAAAVATAAAVVAAPALPSKPGLAARLKSSSAALEPSRSQSQEVPKPTSVAPSPSVSRPDAMATAPAGAFTASPAATLVQSLRVNRGTMGRDHVPSDVADAKRALLQLKAGLALRENSLLSLAGAAQGQASGAALAPVTGVMRPVRKPKSRDEAATKIQAWWRMVLQRRIYKREWQRLRIAREMAASEQTYVEMIEKAFTTFWEPMRLSARSSKPIASQDDVDVIFSRLSDILPLNNFLAQQLAARVAHWTPDKCIGDVFLEFARYNDAAFRQMYEEYTVHYYVAIERVQTCCANPRFRQWLDERQQGGASLQSYLIMPIQRLARYVLLLRQMRKFTLEPHPDTKALDEATALMTVVVSAINEAERHADTDRTAVRQLRELNEKLEPRIADLEQSGRRWIANGELLHLTVIDMAVHSRHYELLNDTLLLTKQRGRTRLTLKQRASLVGARARTLAAADMAALGSGDASLTYSVELNTPSQGFIFAFATDAERQRFMTAFARCDTARKVVAAPPPTAAAATVKVPPPAAVAPAAPATPAPAAPATPVVAAAKLVATAGPAVPAATVASAAPFMSPPPRLQPPPELELSMAKPPALTLPPSLTRSSDDD